MVDISWLVGRTVVRVQRRGHDWQFTLSDEVVLVVECPWRLLTDGKICVSSDDDGQQFGLAAPVDAAAQAAARLAGAPISAVKLGAGTLDLAIECGDHTLEAVPLSSGYEAWQLTRCGDGTSVIACGGGELRCVQTPPA